MRTQGRFDDGSAGEHFEVQQTVDKRLNRSPFAEMKFTVLAFLACLSAALHAADEAEPGAPIREVSPGVFEIGKLRLVRETRTVSFPATVNKAGKDDMLEYLLVNEHGQTHESLLMTAVDPRDLHTAMLLLGAKGGGLDGRAGEFAGGKIDDEFLKHAPKLTGDVIRITATWNAANGDEKSTPIEDWVLNLQTKKPMTRGPWIYNGSTFFDGAFRAQTEGCFAALVTYPPALINNPREGNAQDDIWAVNDKAVPALDTPLTLTIHLETAKK